MARVNTKGKFSVKNERDNGIFVKDFHNRGAIAKFYTENSIVYNEEEAEGNAVICCDAMNTVNECGMLPSELLKQRDEILHRLKELYGSVTIFHDCTENGKLLPEYVKNQLEQAYSEIKKHLKK